MTTYWKLVPILLVFCSTFNSYEAYKILFLYPFATKSHIFFISPVAEQLSARGHDVTLVTPFESLKVTPAIIQKVVPPLDDLNGEVSKDLFENYSKYLALIDALQTGYFTSFMGPSIMEAQVIQELIKNGKQYDIVVINAVFGDIPLVLSKLLGNYTVVASAGPLPPWIPNPGPKPASVLPTYLLQMGTEMPFWDRLINFGVAVSLKLAFYWSLWPASDNVIQKYVPHAMKTAEAWRTISLYLENVDPILVVPRPVIPSVIQIYGTHLHKSKSLPQEYKSFMESANKDGVILFTMGSFVKPQYLLPEITQAFLSAFGRLKQKILWKFEDETLKVPNNVKLVKWMSQRDLLSHPNTRVLITHGGLLSLQEALQHEIPMIGIPIFADQPGNVARIRELGIGEGLDLDNITSEYIYETLQKILNDKRYKNNVKKYSTIFNDNFNPETQAAKGANWIEYIARHNGAKHLRLPGEKLNIFQYFLIDVITFVIVTFLIVIYLFCRMTKLVFRIIFRTKLKSE